MAKRQPHSMLDSAGEMAESVIPTFDSLMETARPILKEGKKIAKGKAKQARKAAKAVSSEKIATFREAEPEKAKGNKVKKLLLVAGLIGIGSVIVRRLMDAPSKSNWQPAYSPAPAPTPRSAPEPEPEPVPDDAGGASPDEALSDDAAEPHADTTPDAPVEVVEVDDVEEPRKPDPLTDPIEEVESPFGLGSALPGPGGEAPGPTYTIKGSKKSKIFHTPESPSYERTKAQVWFTDEEAAAAAGFRHWKADKPQGE